MIRGIRAATLRPPDERINWLRSFPFVLVHVLGIVGIFFFLSPRGVALGIVSCAIRLFFISAGMHRYFSHKSFHASRGFQFVLAFGSTLSVQKGFLWWAGWHRVHHRVADKADDIHSPSRKGFYWSHVGWFLCGKYNDTRWDLVKQWTKYPELVWLNNHWVIPPILLGVVSFLWAGWSGLFVGFFLSTVLVYHATFLINSLAHIPLWWLGSRREHATDDTSQNSLLLALLTFGEGWHNAHHHNARSTKQGDQWWQIDATYYILKLLSLVPGKLLVWDVSTHKDKLKRAA